MVVNDPLSAILTLEGWFIANKLVVILNQTNLMMMMLTIVVFQVWVDVLQEGEDEGNKGLLGLNRIETKMLLAFSVCILAVIPMFPIKVNTLLLDQQASEQCGVGISSGSTDSNLNDFNGEKVLVPVWWALWHSVSQGLTNAAVSSIPCHYNVSNALLQLQQTHITSEPLRNEVTAFYQQCFTKARSAMQSAASQGDVWASDFDNANWLGGAFFLDGNNTLKATSYHYIQAERAVYTVPYRSFRDDPIQEKYGSQPINTDAAYPYCSEWWQSVEANRFGEPSGIKWRVYNDVAKHYPEIAREVQKPDGFFARALGNETTAAERTDMLVERVLSVEQANGRIVRGFGYTLDKGLDHEARELWNAGAGFVGTQVGRVLTGPAYFVVRQAMPMLQAVLMSAVIIASPIVLTISAYNIGTLMSLSLVYAGMMFLTFWWELCRSLDSKLLEGVYQLNENLNPLTGAINYMDDTILKLVMIVLYVLMPAVWFGLLGFAGYKVHGVTFDSAINKINGVVERYTPDPTKLVKK
ncbi:conjugal transfer protein TraG N-terminal domain-containing protein [Vibrio jasicida]|uniref:conjugal transfer protein TraG N-terminal domain-containing protein n=1 Tax=Vibrio jasicida TaxID=766224 RepID=UPI0005F0A4AA|nr:conjugal transfer protein TraG N-terminal domain-containing protein [Vibrio jasicida]